MSQEQRILQINIEQQETYIKQSDAGNHNLNIFTYQYGTNLIKIIESINYFDVVFYEYQKQSENMVFSYINIIDELLEKKNIHIKRIMALIIDDLDGEFLKYINFDYSYLILSNKNYQKSALDLCTHTQKNEVEVHNQRKLKQIKIKDSTVFLRISDGIEFFSVSFDEPVSLKYLKSIVEEAPVVYLENNNNSDNIIKKADILGINRMKYSRLLDRINSF